MTATILKPRLIDHPALLIAGFREYFSDPNAIPAQWQRLAPYLGSIPGQVGRAAYGVCFQDDTGLDYLSGVEVDDVHSLRSDFQFVEIPAQRYAVFLHEGHVSQLYDTLCNIWNEWLPASGNKHSRPNHGGTAFFERYGEGFDPLTGRGDMQVWIPIE